VTWGSYTNNERFLSQAVVMTANVTLSIPGALKATRPEDYHENAATIEWPDGADAQPLAIRTAFYSAPAFKAGGHAPLVKEFVRFLVAEGWLAHYLNFSGERMLPAMPKLLDQPFWLDPSDRHHMVSAIQFLPARAGSTMWSPLATRVTCW
jgi:multiple sugar transport system substrate-binding protein